MASSTNAHYLPGKVCDPSLPFHTLSCERCANYFHKPNVVHPQRDEQGNAIDTIPHGWVKCICCNLVAPRLMELMCGHFCCGDSCKSSHMPFPRLKKEGCVMKRKLRSDTAKEIEEKKEAERIFADKVIEVFRSQTGWLVERQSPLWCQLYDFSKEYTDQDPSDVAILFREKKGKSMQKKERSAFKHIFNPV